MKIQVIATILFAIAILHTFVANQFQKKASQYPEGSVKENLFHLLGEVEVVFGLWAGILILVIMFKHGWNHAVDFTESVNFTEPIFVFAIMTVASTKPIIHLAKSLILKSTLIFRFTPSLVIYFICLTIGPLLGSFITEPAAMTVTAIILLQLFYEKDISDRFKYVTMATLLVNISIGGVLTPYAAPPVLMVANTWNWDLNFMLSHFGWKAALAVFINASIAMAMLYKEILTLKIETSQNSEKIPFWISAMHIIFLALIVMTSHHSTLCMGFFLFFLGVTAITSEYQDELKIRQSLLVAFFLAGLVVLGSFQQWWLEPLLHSLHEFTLFLGATALTAVTDNAALTYLGSQVHDVSDGFKYALVSGAVAGGGLTVIANAPNPAGFSILQGKFKNASIAPFKLLLHALIPTLVAMFCFWVFKS
jgi:hypothetical protein